MNDFEYMIKIKAIKEMTTLKAREEVLRDLARNPKYTLLQQYSYSKATEVLEERNPYKCYTKALADYTGKHLPLFLTGTGSAADAKMFRELVKAEVSYEQFCDYLEYTPHFTMNNERISEFLPKLATVIQDNPVPVEITYKFSLSSAYNGMTNDFYAYPVRNIMDTIVEIENVKSKMPLDIRYTVIEKLLDIEYTKLQQAGGVIIDSAKTFVEQTDNWARVSRTILARIS